MQETFSRGKEGQFPEELNQIANFAQYPYNDCQKPQEGNFKD